MYSTGRYGTDCLRWTFEKSLPRWLAVYSIRSYGTGLVLLSTTKLALHHYKWNLCENVAKSSKMEFCQITKVGFLQIGVYSIDSIYVIWCDVDN